MRLEAHGGPPAQGQVRQLDLLLTAGHFRLDPAYASDGKNLDR